MVAFSFTMLAVVAAEPESESSATTPAEVLDEVVVSGATVSELQAAAIKAEDRLLARYNELNKDDELDIRCIQYTPTGTRFSYRYCLTRLQARAQQKDGTELLNFMQSFDVQNGQAPPIPLVGARLLESWKQYRQNVVQLLQDNPDLRELVRERAVAMRRYEAARRKR